MNDSKETGTGSNIARQAQPMADVSAALHEPPLRRALALAAWLIALAAACDESRPPVPVRDSGPRADTGAREDAGVPEDAGPIDAAPVDARFQGDGEMPIDGGGPPPPCAIDPDVGAVVVGRDSDVRRRPRIVTAASPTELVAVLSDDGDGTRRVRLIRQPLMSRDPVSREDLPGIPDGAGAPSVVRAGDGWLVAYEAPGGGIAVQRYSSAWSATGAASVIASAGNDPALAVIGSGAFVAWREGTRLMGRALAASGAPTGAASELGTLPAADAHFAIQPYGRAGEALVAVGSAEGMPARAMARRIGATGTPAPGWIMLGATTEAEGAIAIGSATTRAPAGTEPLNGAAAFDVRVAGFAEVRFVLVGPDGMPAFGEFTVSDRGQPAWGAGVASFRDGYVVAYRARPEDLGFSRVWLGFLERDSCRLGRVDSRLVADVSASERGGPVSVTSQGETVFAAWAEQLADLVEYRVATAHCR
jgi:hypothetical protein